MKKILFTVITLAACMNTNGQIRINLNEDYSGWITKVYTATRKLPGCYKMGRLSTGLGGHYLTKEVRKTIDLGESKLIELDYSIMSWCKYKLTKIKIGAHDNFSKKDYKFTKHVLQIEHKNSGFLDKENELNLHCKQNQRIPFRFTLQCQNNKSLRLTFDGNNTMATMNLKRKQNLNINFIKED